LKGRSKTAQPHVFAQQYSSATFVSTIKKKTGAHFKNTNLRFTSFKTV